MIVQKIRSLNSRPFQEKWSAGVAQPTLRPVFGIVALLWLSLSSSAQAQTRMVLENLEREKRVMIDTGDIVRVQFLADSVLRRSYRPWGYRKKDKRVSYVQAEIIEYTDSSFVMIPRRQFIRRLLVKQSDTISVNLDQVMAINKTSTFKLLGTYLFTQVAARGVGLVVLTATGNFWVFFGFNAASIVLSPFTRKYVRHATIPMRKIPRQLADWKLYLEDPPTESVRKARQ